LRLFFLSTGFPCYNIEKPYKISFSHLFSYHPNILFRELFGQTDNFLININIFEKGELL
jgi:hypothetical protein